MQRLVYSIPLQQVYEMIHFDNFDLKTACMKLDKLKDYTLSATDF